MSNDEMNEHLIYSHLAYLSHIDQMQNSFPC